MPFRIIGVGGEGLTSASRYQAGSAAVLAMKWIEGGMREVRIIDNAGRDYSLEHFRAHLRQRGTKFTPF